MSMPANSHFAYPNLLDAVKGVLLETCRSLDQQGVQYVVAGGWGPYLGARHPVLQHPGTADVDVLFNDQPDPIRNAVKALLGAGYTPSAKHPFQLLKKLSVGTDAFVFNVDLMHPRESKLKGELFQDILDLGVRTDYRTLQTAAIRSVAFPSSRIVFDEKLWRRTPVAGALPNGTLVTHEVPIIDGAAIVLSKCESVAKPKRDRDAFDIYYVLTGRQGGSVEARLKMLAQFPQVKDQLSKLRAFLTHPDNDFAIRVNKFAGSSPIADPVGDVLARLP